MSSNKSFAPRLDASNSSKFSEVSTRVDLEPIEEEFDGDLAYIEPVGHNAILEFSDQAEQSLNDPQNYPFMKFWPKPIMTANAEHSKESDVDADRAAPKYTGHYRLNFEVDGAVKPGSLHVGIGPDVQGQSGTKAVDMVLTSNRHLGVRARHCVFRIHLNTGLVSVTVCGSAQVLCSSSETIIENTTYFFPTCRNVELLNIGQLLYRIVWRQSMDKEAFAKYLSALRTKLGYKGYPSPHLTGIHTHMHVQFGKYVHQNELGSGSQGIVVCAYNTRDGTVVAVKTLRSRENAYSMMQTETAIAKAAKHPNVIKLVEAIDYESHTFEGKLHLVLSPLCHSSLDETMDLSLEHRRGLVAQGMYALDYLHNVVGIMHRDIKPANVLIHWVSKDKPLLVFTDFGHSTFGTTSRNHRRGTIKYLAPEVLALKRESRQVVPLHVDDYDLKADVWSWGLTVAHLAIDQHVGDFIPSSGITTHTLKEIFLAVVLQCKFEKTWNVLISSMLSWEPRTRSSSRDLIPFFDLHGWSCYNYTPQKDRRNKRQAIHALYSTDGERNQKKRATANVVFNKTSLFKADQQNNRPLRQSHVNQKLNGAGIHGNEHERPRQDVQKGNGSMEDEDDEENLSGSIKSLSIEKVKKNRSDSEDDSLFQVSSSRGTAIQGGD